MLPAGFRLGDNDSRILAVALNFAAEGRDVTLVSKDLPMRVKASAVGLHAEEYRAELAVESGWTGMAELEVGSGADRPAVRRTACSTWTAARDLPCHTGVVLLGGNASALGRVTPDKELRLVKADRDAFGIHGRSAEQRVALDLLLDPSVGIVSLGGRAGTGQVRSRPVRRAGGGAGTPAALARWSSSGRCTPSAARSSATCPARRARRWRPGRRPCSTPSARSPPRW